MQRGSILIPFKKNAIGAPRGSPAWKKAYHYFQLNREEFEDRYHKRSNVESTFGAVKKKFGETIKSKNLVAQQNELLCKFVAYNITILIKPALPTKVSGKLSLWADGPLGPILWAGSLD